MQSKAGQVLVSGLRKLLTPKWLLGHLLAVGLVVSFVNFGFWQLRRLDSRVASNELIASRMEAAPVALAELLAGVPPEEAAYRRVFASGRFEPEHEILLRSRSREGQPGWHVLTPLVRGNGSAVLVDRGWVPRAYDEPPVAEAAPPAGMVRVEGLLRLEQDPPTGWAASISPRDPAEGELARAYYVDVDRLATQYPYPLLPLYLELTGIESVAARSQPARPESGSPPRTGGLPLLPQPPELGRGPHLSYALQWFSFALIGVIGYATLLWRTARAPERP